MCAAQAESGRPVADLLRPGKTPSGIQVRTLLKHLVGRIRRHWPRTRLTFRGDGHYGRHEAMDWCEDNGVDFIFGLAGNAALHDLADFDYAARSWNRKRRIVARLEAMPHGFDARYIVTSLTGEPGHLYEAVYYVRGQAENLIKLYGAQLASDRTSCQSPPANQFPLVLHTAAYWLMLALRRAAQDAARPGRVRDPHTKRKSYWTVLDARVLYCFPLFDLSLGAVGMRRGVSVHGFGGGSRSLGGDR